MTAKRRLPPPIPLSMCASGGSGTDYRYEVWVEADSRRGPANAIRGELHIMLPDSRMWETAIGFVEIALFVNPRWRHFKSIYLNEMTLNAEAATSPFR